MLGIDHRPLWRTCHQSKTTRGETTKADPSGREAIRLPNPALRHCDDSTLLTFVSVLEHSQIRVIGLRKITAARSSHASFFAWHRMRSEHWGDILTYWTRLSRIQRSVQTPQAIAGFVVIFLSVLLNAFWIDMAIGGFGLVIAAAMGVVGFALFYRGWTVDDH